jgi:hypothetical protein
MYQVDSVSFHENYVYVAKPDTHVATRLSLALKGQNEENPNRI